MKRCQNQVLILLLLMMFGPLLAQEKETVGFYQSWMWKQYPVMMNPAAIPYGKLTAINYAFFYPLESGEILGMDPAADRYLLQGEADDMPAGAEPAASIIELARAHGTRVLLSIGGWETSGNFPQVAADPQKRARFAHGCIRHIRNYGFDGIDIDWEFPGYVRHNGTPQDRFNFTYLLQTVRDSLAAYGKTTGRQYLLSASLPAAAGHLPDIDVQKITPILDYLNIMTYDLFGPWGKISNHHTALYGPAQGDSARCLDGAFKLYHDIHGVPAEKINLCAAFSGHVYTNCTEIYGEHQGGDNDLFPAGDGVLYAHIMEKADWFERQWDPVAQAPYLVSASRKILISLDDEASVALKADYIIRNKAHGLVIWPLMGDHLKDGRTPLLDAIYQKFGSH